VNERYGQNERVYWLPVICWNGLAETVSNFLHKGSRVAVTGRITTRSYEANGEPRTVTEIVANGVDFLDPKPANQEPKAEGSTVPDDEIPF
jgi:single-strand DNA-binding protein